VSGDLRVAAPIFEIESIERRTEVSRCIITGCDLVVHGQKWCHGDLHREGDCYIFDACRQGVETYWQYTGLPGEDRMVLTVDGDYFEKCGVIVTSCGFLNDKAFNYVNTPVSWIDSVLGS
jgi:hypothetical protein